MNNEPIDNMFVETDDQTTGPDDEEKREEDGYQDCVSMLAHITYHNVTNKV